MSEVFKMTRHYMESFLKTRDAMKKIKNKNLDCNKMSRLNLDHLLDHPVVGASVYFHLEYITFLISTSHRILTTFSHVTKLTIRAGYDK